ncbi:MAG: GNAT family N-acetyltransferase [Planctomycetes bacterium]|nr:GNAT family N-acetyltransferase [Planctomycetota bacterium]
MSAPEIIRPFEDRDLDALLALRARCFDGLDLERERVRRKWAFDDNPARQDGMPPCWIAELDGEVVGTYGMLPAKVYIDGTATPAICGVDFCVAPELRGRGLGRRLTAAMVETAGSRFRFITSPTAATTALMQERGAGVVDAAAEGALFARPGSLPTAAPTAAAAALEVRQLTGFGGECDALAARLAPHHRFVTVRDAAYLRWRYVGDPYVRHVVFGAFEAAGANDGAMRGLGVLTLSPTEPQGYVAELAVEPHDLAAARALLAALADAARERELEAIFALERRPSLQPILHENDFTAMPTGAPEPVLLLLGGTVDPKDWLLSPGDGDFLFRIGSAG